jgi:hypothetical protein
MSELNSRDAFDLRARAELELAYEADAIPAHLFRHTPWHARRAVRLSCVLALVTGAILSLTLALRPPELVRAAIDHEYYERTLRGNFMAAGPLLAHLGLSDRPSVPGYPQLMRPCDIDGKLVYHLTTFFERGGMVTVFAFEKPVELKEQSGWWRDVYWQVVPSREEGRSLILVSEKKQALAVAYRVFARQPA